MKVVFLTLLISVFLQTNYAQNFHGHKEGNFAGILSTDLNPANIADSRFKFDMTLGAISLDLYNTYLGYKGSLFSLAGVTNGPVWNWIKTDALEFKDKEVNSLYLNNEIVLPSFQFDINEKSAIGFKWKVRSYFNVDGLESELSKLTKEQFDYSSLWNSNFNNENLSIQTMSWAEYGITYGHVIMDNETHFLKVGGSVKLLQGLQAVYMFVEDLEYNFTSDDTLSLFQSDVHYGHSTNLDIQDNVKYKFVSNPGIGLDIGAVYEWRPDWQDYKYDMDGQENKWRKDLNKYKMRFGLSVLDIGGIRFDKGDKSRNFRADVNAWDLDQLSFNSIAEFDDTLFNRFQLLADEGDFKMNLPTAISTQIDYNFGKGFFINLNTYTSFQFTKDEHKSHGYSNYALIPRYDHKYFTAALPLSYSNLTGFRAGLSMRLGIAYFGTSNLASLAGLGDIKGGDFHVGFKIPIYHNVEKDKDQDAVSNKFDDCPDIKGVWAFKGCPDTDNDMIPDSEDKCPAEFGLVEFGGCPDTDRDGIPDKEDECPTLFGKKELSGCPDVDGDGIRDSKDDCPDIAGLPAFNGCPDTDEDGIADKVDNCPLEAGPASNLGCPIGVKLHLVDRFGDIVATAVLNENGEFEFRNISAEESYLFLLEGEDPTIDDIVMVTITDDGGVVVQRFEANLNTRTGYFQYRTISTEEESTLSFMEEESVNVILKEEEQALLNTAFTNLEFETGQAIIKTESFESLAKLVDLISKKEAWKIKIEGHTDNTGDAGKNLILSKRRADAVKLYLVQRGISKDRIITKFFGSSKPIADNETAEGRQENRRVEMNIVE